MRSLLLACLASASILVASPSIAGPPEEVKASAAAAGEQGLALFESGKWREAYEAFRRADGLYHAPTLVLYMAHCQKALGKLAAARWLYRRVAAEPLPPGVPHQFMTAQAVAREESERLKTSVALLKIGLRGVPVERVSVTLDGEALPAIDAVPRDVDPGEHVLEAKPERGAPERRVIVLKQGSTTEVIFSFAPPPPPDTPPPPPAAAPPKPKQAPELWIPGVISVGAGLAEIGIGAAVGLMSLSQAGDLKSRCRVDSHCPSTDRNRATSAIALADASTALFILGGLSAAAGGALLLLNNRRDKANGPRSSALSIDVGVGYAGVRGAF